MYIDISKKEASRTIHTIEEFSDLIKRERFRSDRNNQKFSLITFDIGEINNTVQARLLIKTLESRLRLSDEIGWFDKKRIAVLLPETPIEGARKLAHSIYVSITGYGETPPCTVYMYPSLQWIDGESYTNPSCPQESVQEKFAIGHRVPLWKRSMDIFGSFIGLLILSPILLTTAALIKIVSPGPVFFKQERVGRFGKIFTLFKFRTMKVNNDAGEHREYLKELINGDSSEEKPMIKLADEARIIPMGKFIRSTCIDELPQLINVLIGDMSLIGPRPCIPYEAQEYLRWHERRFDIIPGMTGLWQVSGKNNTTFKGMIRLDIKYAAERSFLLDLKILFKTPIVVISQILGSFQKTKPATSAGRKRIDVKTAEMAVETAEVA